MTVTLPTTRTRRRTHWRPVPAPSGPIASAVAPPPEEVPRYQPGQRLRHPEFGEGLVVEVHTDRGRQTLEVVFHGTLRRLSADRSWAVLEGGGESPAGNGPPASSRTWHPGGEQVVQRWLSSTYDPPATAALRVAAERWGAWVQPDRLMCLESLRGVERFDHQLRACRAVMSDLNGRAILADEVGLGKTIEAGIIIKEYVLRGAVRTVLVLVPASLCEQWRAELAEKFELEFVVSRGPAGLWGRHPFVISSLETARHERHRPRVRGAGYDLVVVDEAHRLRNHLTLGWKFLNDLNPRYLLLLTATPIQNDLRELYNLATLVQPGGVGTYAQFCNEFMAGGDRRVPRNTARLRGLLQNIMIRTRRADTDIVFTPRKVETVWVPQSADERRLYRDVSQFISAAVRTPEGAPGHRWYFTLMVLQKEMGSSWHAARSTLERMADHPDGLAVERLRLLASRARGLDSGNKAQVLVKRLREMGDEKAVVFTQFRNTLEGVVATLRAEGIEPAVFHGELGWREKEDQLERFRTQARVLVSTEAGGEGRNLQFCRTIVNYDLPWNPMRLEQRIGRVHRLGQKLQVRVLNLVARGTIESYVLEILDRKIQMFQLVIGEVEEILGAWQPGGSFEDEVFRRWVESPNPAARRRRFNELAQHLALARRQYQEEKDRQDLIFPSET
jgi:SNF2 family DNA or RNA helicase